MNNEKVIKIILFLSIFFLNINFTFAKTSLVAQTSYQKEEHKHSETMELFNQEFNRELWRQPQPHKTIFTHAKWIFILSLILWFFLIFTDKYNPLKNKRK
ncbi:MAG: hypothetical protein HYU63_00930 [Armatimonadetes bacterium]|nr:hypothetical protein [Armatimonadota bacterium]